MMTRDWIRTIVRGALVVGLIGTVAAGNARAQTPPAGAQTPPQFQAFVASEYDRWGKTIKGANIKAE